MTDRVSVIGVGLLGTALAGRLLGSGFSVTGYDAQAEALERLRARGGEAAASVAEAVGAAPVILLSLPNAEIVERVVAEIAEARPAGKWVLDTTTVAPGVSEAMTAELARVGCRYADLTIAGSSEETAAGKAVAMFGGSAAELEELAPVVGAISRERFALGAPGAAARMKLVSNLVLGLHRAVLAEALVFAEALGLSAADALAVLKTTSSYSAVMDWKGAKMVEREFAPVARLKQHLKDVRLMCAEAQRSGAPAPLTTLHEGLLARAVELGFGDLDNSAILRVYEAMRDEATQDEATQGADAAPPSES